MTSQSSSQGVINFSRQPLLEPEERARAKRKFYRLVNRFQYIRHGVEKYNRPLLIRYTYEYTLSDESRDFFLQAFFQYLALSMTDDGDLHLSDEELVEELGSAFSNFSDYLLDNFFLPLKASTKKTLQPSPVFLSASLDAQGRDRLFLGTLDRVAALRGDCLLRDRHRCVVSRKFDSNEAVSRGRRDGDDARDDDGDAFLEGLDNYAQLEVAHILPYSLTETKRGSSGLSSSKRAALVILNMFDYGVLDLINGHDIDRPRNAMSLTSSLHKLFGDFELYFTPVDAPGAQPHTYRIDSFLPQFIIQDGFPVTRTLYSTDSCTIEPPSSRLLAIHSAIAHVLHLSKAGEYIDKLLRDFSRKSVRADGSTELDRFIKLRLGGWNFHTINQQ
ncbi:hypothetical protein Trco_005521 [Trichoderma cornu-damae]|uniref:HNH nuclease domain-containing protein n=1 Tax=Trichoderma cornu-damae TaxID=654480 RepID=A0A9P8TVG4_9HYPO|nr:hypothetical protein Trco_005521 [Trichoderma cornu-damae]